LIVGSRADWAFAEIDVARVRLIRDLRLRMELQEDALTVILSLLDQVYGLGSLARDGARARGSAPGRAPGGARFDRRRIFVGPQSLVGQPRIGSARAKVGK
jgi:hypothetical protein